MYKALIIDDEKPVRIAISKLGAWSRFHLEIPACAENGKQALTLMRELSPSIVFVSSMKPGTTYSSVRAAAFALFLSWLTVAVPLFSPDTKR